MRLMADRGVRQEEHEAAAPGAITPSWENVQTFLEVVRHGSFRSAADRLKLSINGLRRRIDDLEIELGFKVLTRHIGGVSVTPEAEEVLAAAKRMEAASFELVRARDRAAPSVAGRVKLAVTEAFGAFWLAPRLVEFQRANPKLFVDLRCAMRSADVLRLEADAAIQLTQPVAPDLKMVKLGRIHSIPCAAPSYLAIYGTPKTPADLSKHRLALQFAEQTGTKENYDRLFPGVPLDGFAAFCTNNSSALLWAIIAGAGIGCSPTYMHAMRPKYVALDIGLVFSFDIWLTYHPDAARSPRVRRLLDWVIESFDPRKFPWFRDEFIHPRDLPNEYHGPPLVNLFEGLTWPKDDVGIDR